MISNHRAAAGIVTAAIAVCLAGFASFAHAQQPTPPLTCDAEAARINQALQLAHEPALCARCAERLAQTLDSLYTRGVLPNFYTSADNADWDDPQRRPAMMSGRSLARLPDGTDLVADIDSGFGPRGIHRLRYTQANRPIAVTTVDRGVSIPVSFCTREAAH
ncbi:UNVERIFIED_ORG: hypothetical protein ABIC54_001452 [Burkholderia sp. 1263]